MVSRRGIIKSLGLAVGAVALGNSQAYAQLGAIDASARGLLPNTGSDISTALQSLVDLASASGQPLFLPTGEYQASRINLPTNTVIVGVRGQTRLLSNGVDPIFVGHDAANLQLEDLVFNGRGTAGEEGFGLVDFVNCSSTQIQNCFFANSSGIGISLFASGSVIVGNGFTDLGNAAIASTDAIGLNIQNNSIDGCGNNGILVWRNDQGHDGSIVTGNRIKNIDWRAGGNGQNGNGINVFRAADVVVSNNVITDCAFSAIRANASVNCQIIANNCRNLSEVAIFSEFEFSGSIVANNVVDDAAQGISITNWNDGGHLAVCTGNIVRNIWAKSPTNPDTVPVGIGVEADIVVDGNVVENVPGSAIAAGWGQYMRNISITDNLIQKSDFGINVSLVDGVGAAQVKDNILSQIKKAAIVGTRWDEVIEDDLQTVSDQYPLLNVAGNVSS